MTETQVSQTQAPPKIKQSCRVDKCGRPYRAKGYCRVHYKKWRRSELPHSRYKTCVTEGCHKKAMLKLLCEEHYKARTGKKEEKTEISVPPTAA